LTKHLNNLIVFGESIWDLFEDGSKSLGGSGLNIVWHLCGFDRTCHFLSRIGQDDNGKQLIASISAWGISDQWIQIDSAQPTAYLDVILDEIHGHQYPSPPFHALDFITYDQLWEDLPRDGLLYHGTYMLRQNQTRETLRQLKSLGFPIFLDLNLRENYWSQSVLDECVRGLAFLKLSDQEFNLWFPTRASQSDTEKIKHLQAVMGSRQVDHILYTQGARGSVLITKDDIFFQKPSGGICIKNTVGAGDAFCAGFILSYLEGKSIKASMDLATKLAELMCQTESATFKQKEPYVQFRQKHLNL